MPLPQGTSIANLNSIQLRQRSYKLKIYFLYYFNQPDSLTHSQVQHPKGTQDWCVLVGSCWVLVGSSSCSVPVLVSMSRHCLFDAITLHHKIIFPCEIIQYL